MHANPHLPLCTTDGQIRSMVCALSCPCRCDLQWGVGGTWLLPHCLLTDVWSCYFPSMHGRTQDGRFAWVVATCNPSQEYGVCSPLSWTIVLERGRGCALAPSKSAAGRYESSHGLCDKFQDSSSSLSQPECSLRASSRFEQRHHTGTTCPP